MHERRGRRGAQELCGQCVPLPILSFFGLVVLLLQAQLGRLQSPEVIRLTMCGCGVGLWQNSEGSSFSCSLVSIF